MVKAIDLPLFAPVLWGQQGRTDKFFLTKIKNITRDTRLYPTGTCRHIYTLIDKVVSGDQGTYFANQNTQNPALQYPDGWGWTLEERLGLAYLKFRTEGGQQLPYFDLGFGELYDAYFVEGTRFWRRNHTWPDTKDTGLYAKVRLFYVEDDTGYIELYTPMRAWETGEIGTSNYYLQLRTRIQLHECSPHSPEKCIQIILERYDGSNWVEEKNWITNIEWESPDQKGGTPYPWAQGNPIDIHIQLQRDTESLDVHYDCWIYCAFANAVIYHASYTLKETAGIASASNHYGWKQYGCAAIHGVEFRYLPQAPVSKFLKIEKAGRYYFVDSGDDVLIHERLSTPLIRTQIGESNSPLYITEYHQKLYLVHGHHPPKVIYGITEDNELRMDEFSISTQATAGSKVGEAYPKILIQHLGLIWVANFHYDPQFIQVSSLTDASGNLVEPEQSDAWDTLRYIRLPEPITALISAQSTYVPTIGTRGALILSTPTKIFEFYGDDPTSESAILRQVPSKIGILYPQSFGWISDMGIFLHPTGLYAYQAGVVEQILALETEKLWEEIILPNIKNITWIHTETFDPFMGSNRLWDYITTPDGEDTYTFTSPYVELAPYRIPTTPFPFKGDPDLLYMSPDINLHDVIPDLSIGCHHIAFSEADGTGNKYWLNGLGLNCIVPRIRANERRAIGWRQIRDFTLVTKLYTRTPCAVLHYGSPINSTTYRTETVHDTDSDPRSYTATLSYPPIHPGRVSFLYQISLDGGSTWHEYEGYDDGDGNLVGDYITGQIDYTTGEVNIRTDYLIQEDISWDYYQLPTGNFTIGRGYQCANSHIPYYGDYLWYAVIYDHVNDKYLLYYFWDKEFQGKLVWQIYEDTELGGRWHIKAILNTTTHEWQEDIGLGGTILMFDDSDEIDFNTLNGHYIRRGIFIFKRKLTDDEINELLDWLDTREIYYSMPQKQDFMLQVVLNSLVTQTFQGMNVRCYYNEDDLACIYTLSGQADFLPVEILHYPLIKIQVKVSVPSGQSPDITCVNLTYTEGTHYDIPRARTKENEYYLYLRGVKPYLFKLKQEGKQFDYQLIELPAGVSDFYFEDEILYLLSNKRILRYFDIPSTTGELETNWFVGDNEIKRLYGCLIDAQGKGTIQLYTMYDENVGWVEITPQLSVDELDKERSIPVKHYINRAFRFKIKLTGEVYLTSVKMLYESILRK